MQVTVPKTELIVAFATDGATSRPRTTTDNANSLYGLNIVPPSRFSRPSRAPTIPGGAMSTGAYCSEYVSVPPYTHRVDSVKIGDDLLIPAGRHTLVPDEVSARQRERLLRGMGRCVSENGYTKTTIADVVRVARTSRSVFYRHFADKEECFVETYRQMTGVRIRASLDAAATVSSWQAKLDLGIATYFRWMAEHPEVAITTVVEVHRAGRAALEARGVALEQWMRTVEGVAVLARAAGDDVTVDETACAAIITTSEAYVHDYARRGCLDQVVERTQSVQALARSLFAERAPPVAAAAKVRPSSPARGPGRPGSPRRGPKKPLP